MRLGLESDKSTGSSDNSMVFVTYGHINNTFLQVLAVTYMS